MTILELSTPVELSPRPPRSGCCGFDLDGSLMGEFVSLPLSPLPVSRQGELPFPGQWPAAGRWPIAGAALPLNSTYAMSPLTQIKSTVTCRMRSENRRESGFSNRIFPVLIQFSRQDLQGTSR